MISNQNNNDEKKIINLLSQNEKNQNDFRASNHTNLIYIGAL